MQLRFVCALVFLCVVDDVTCNRYLSCKTPTLKYGRLRSRQRGRSIKFVCNVGYQLAGEKNAFCINGTWDVDIPKCVRGTCARKETPPLNGLLMPSHNWAVMNFYCKQGFELNGPGTVFCDGFTWDNSKPSCIPSNTKPSLFCDFENENICHWTHDLNHDMDWVRDSYKTPTGYSMPTGPSHDHTKGAGSNGHYMYIESSSRRINDTARLISPVFGKPNGTVCLEFWYHMYGKTTGTLKAYVKRAKDPWPLDPDRAVFSKSGNQGNVWYRAIINLGPIVDDFQIVMEGIRGNGYISDIAIDDVNVIPDCNFDELMQTTTEAIPETTEILKTMGSCENVCGEKALPDDNPQIIPCDCDEFCYESSKCCPDYIDLCLNSSTSEDTTTSYDYTTSKLTKITNKTTVIQTRPSTLTTFNPKTSISQKLTTKSMVVPTEKRTTRKQDPIPTLIMLQPPTTPLVIQRIIPPTKNISKITFVKPKKPLPSKAYNDDIDVPTRFANDEELLLTSPWPINEDSNDINGDDSLEQKETYVEKVSKVKEYPSKITSDVGEIKTEFQHVKEQSGVNALLVTILTISAIVALGVAIALALVKFKPFRFRNRRMTSGQGDSQSDVRFLTADEVLDFSLDKDYDGL